MIMHSNVVSVDCGSGGDIGGLKTRDDGYWKNLYSDSLQLSPHEQGLLGHFVQCARERALKFGVMDEKWRMSSVATDAQIELSNLNKNLLLAMWIEFLDVMRSSISPENLKYSTIEDFLDAYPVYKSPKYSNEEKINLMNNANWMNILFKMEKAKKNKGLVMDVIPRLVEGPSARYVTGSGQTQATADRVLIYETEGGISPVVRGKRRKMKPLMDFESGRDGFRKSLSKHGQRKRKSNLSIHRRVVPRVESIEEVADTSTPVLQHCWAGDDDDDVSGSVQEQLEIGFDENSSDNQVDQTPISPEKCVVAKQSEAEAGYVTWSVDLNHFQGLSSGSAERRTPRDRSDSIVVDFTDGAEDSDEHDVDTSSEYTNNERCLDDWVDDDLTRLKNILCAPDDCNSGDSDPLPDYWDGITRGSSGSDAGLCLDSRVEGMPVLLRHPTDRDSLLELLEEVGGPNNPVTMDTELDPMMFASNSVSSCASQSMPSSSPPVMARMVSWGGLSCDSHTTKSQASLPGFPAPHSSFHSDLPDVQDGD